jgi:hypothetical protein
MSERFGCLPSQFLAEDGETYRLLHIEALGLKEEGGELWPTR